MVTAHTKHTQGLETKIVRAEALWSVRLIASNVLIPSPSPIIGEGLVVPEVSHGAHMADRTERRSPQCSSRTKIVRAEALWSMRLISSNVLIPSPSPVIGEGLGVPEVSHGAHMADWTERHSPQCSTQDEKIAG